MAVIPVQRQPLTFAERIYLPAFLRSMVMITLKHLFSSKVSLEYP